MHLLSDQENERAKKIWGLMDEDMREFVKALVDLGMMDGRAGLACCKVAVLPDQLPVSNGVVPYVPTQAERMAGQKRKDRT